MTTKEKILAESLTLFSEKGYEATSVDMIAAAVGIKGPSLYKHFKGKQDIFDSLIASVSRYYDERSFFTAHAEETQEEFSNLTPEEIAEKFCGQIHFLLTNPVIKKVRQLLTIEQFSNENIKKLQTSHSYTTVLDYHIGLIKKMIEKDKLADKDPVIMASQLCFPISMWLALCDREPEREEEIDILIKKHVIQFFDAYKK